MVDAAAVQLPVYRGSKCSPAPHRDAVYCTRGSTKHYRGSRVHEDLRFLMIMLFIGLDITKRPVKSVLPENSFLSFLIGRYKPRVLVKSAETVAERRRVAEVPETVETVACDSSRIPTVKIVSVLRDPLGNPLNEPRAGSSC